MRPARSLLFVPGHRRAMIDKALGLTDLDVAILDLEDGVPPGEAEAARREVGAAARGRAAVRLFVRVHRAGPELDADVAALGPTVEAVVLSKVESPDDVRAVGDAVARVAPTAMLIPSIESASALLRAADIARASRRVAGLMFGGEDFARDLGLPLERTAEAQDLLYVRSAVVVAAAAARVAAYDSVWTDVADLQGLRRQALQARRLGFTGKTLIHPSHVAVVNDAFTPSAAEVARARRVVAAFDEAVKSGRGAVAVEGEMVDAPVVERARRVLELADPASR